MLNARLAKSAKRGEQFRSADSPAPDKLDRQDKPTLSLDQARDPERVEGPRAVVNNTG